MKWKPCLIRTNHMISLVLISLFAFSSAGGLDPRSFPGARYPFTGPPRSVPPSPLVSVLSLPASSLRSSRLGILRHGDPAALSGCCRSLASSTYLSLLGWLVRMRNGFQFDPLVLRTPSLCSRQCFFVTLTCFPENFLLE
jgi:hypothetical protein